ncbi:uncharacterized protein JN550_002288 [Neoarthrinium moseri]|uniref:uncharacterized protein n=1 Tax=Neoarthrinium moseri TaxID=1658444 RepID=UPI001FDC1D2F|nr:uncharacterized protein JN550_002288 [Neoarthrinium moseri]KAI1874859.1 hypothetical protein JN550_002288 [Neoarthrinium moseri]
MPKKNAPKAAASSSAQTGDSRFANFQSDPRFRLPSKKSTKTKIDKRFSRVLNDEDFTKTTKVDRYGRKLKSDNKAKALKSLYQEESDDDNSNSDSDSDAVDDDEEIQRELKKAEAKANYDPARGGGFSSSESDSDSEDDDEDEDDDEGGAAVAQSGSMQRLRDAQADVEVGEITKRIAVVNLDWDHIKSADLLSLMSSFVPSGGRIDRVSIYPSEFGKERMQREELEGPPKEIFKKKAHSDDESSDAESQGDSDDDKDDDIEKDLIQEGDDQDFDSDALRSYQLDRLRYYYAIVLCSDEATAEQIYKAVDGTEYQSSSNFMDLRFVPDELTFDDEPRDECESVPLDYRPTEFITDALQHSKVKLTWDMHPDEASRRDKINRAFSGSRAELEENDMKAYLASSDSEGDDDEPVAEADEDQPKLSKKELARQRMREALGLGAETASKSSKSGPVGEMEMTFALDDEGEDKKEDSPDREETTVEKYMRKEREKKARKKEKYLAKREGAANGAEKEDAQDQEGEDLGFDDPFFTTEQPAKATKTSQRKEERLKKREQKEEESKKTAVEKAQLEKIMADDSKAAADHLDHFDMNEIARAEKQKFKKGKGKKKQKDVQDRGGLQEGFKMDTSDDRFKAVFDSHEFAIDPSNPKFKATPGMKQLLEEGRKKRSHGDDASSRDKKKARRR